MTLDKLLNLSCDLVSSCAPAVAQSQNSVLLIVINRDGPFKCGNKCIEKPNMSQDT